MTASTDTALLKKRPLIAGSRKRNTSWRSRLQAKRNILHHPTWIKECHRRAITCPDLPTGLPTFCLPSDTHVRICPQLWWLQPTAYVTKLMSSDRCQMVKGNNCNKPELILFMEYKGKQQYYWELYHKIIWGIVRRVYVIKNFKI